MKEFDLGESRTKFKVKWAGEEYICTCPSQSYLVEYKVKLDNAGSKEVDINDLALELLDHCGLPKSASSEMEPEQISDLLQFIGGKKK